jgi:hypothetical protein
MRRDVLALTVALSFVARSAQPAPIQIQIRGERIDIRADNTPLVQILNGVAWEAKMKIVYDAPPPQDPVTVNIKNATFSQAITDLLNGHGLIYVAKMDAAGTRVDTLVLTSGNPGEVHINTDAPPVEEAPPVDTPPEYVPPDMPPPEMPTAVQPTSAPASAWTPQPVMLPGVIGGPGAAPTASPTPFVPMGRVPPGYMGHGAPGAPPYQPPPPPPPPSE